MNGFFVLRVRGKMRFWGKTKQGEKKSSRDRLIYSGESLDGDYPDTALLMAEGEMMDIWMLYLKKKNYSHIESGVKYFLMCACRGVLVSSSQPWCRLPARIQGEQGALAQNEAAPQCEDQQCGSRARPVAERRTADPHMCQWLQEYEWVPHEEGTATVSSSLQIQRP